MLLVQFSVHKADRIKCLLMFPFVEFFVCCYCQTKNSHTLGFLLDSFSQLSQFWFSDIRITNGGMCLMRKALLIKLGQKWFEPNLTRSGSLIDVKDNDNDDATCSSVGRSRCFACLLGGRWKNQQFARSNNHRK